MIFCQANWIARDIASQTGLMMLCQSHDTTSPSRLRAARKRAIAGATMLLMTHEIKLPMASKTGFRTLSHAQDTAVLIASQRPIQKLRKPSEFSQRYIKPATRDPISPIMKPIGLARIAAFRPRMAPEAPVVAIW